MLLLLLFGVFCLGLRRPSCVGTARNVSASDLELFRYAFRDFEEGASRIGGRDFLNFEFLIGNGMGLIDQASFLVVARQAELLVNSLNVSASDTLSLISKLFRLRAESGLGDASEQAAWWTLAFRFNQSDMQAFNRQYALLERATPCQLVQISGLFGLWCPSPSATAPRVIAMTGFDGSLLTVYAEVCKDANAHGLSCLCLMGPGQGESAVLGNARFVSDWGGVVQKAAEWLGGKGPIMLWCRSFGGQLCARVGQTTPNVSAIVLDGAILDMFQNTLCGLPTKLQDLFYASRAQFDAIMLSGEALSPALQSILAWAKIGFGPNVTSFGLLLEAFEPFFLGPPDLQALRNIPVFVNDPQLDTATNMQSLLFWQALAPPHDKSVLLQPNLESGVALHCGVGSNKANANNIITWINDVLANTK